MDRFQKLSNHPLFVLTAILVALGIASVASAADGETALGPGVWSVELGLSIDDSFDGGTIALKRNSSAGTAWRIGFGADIQNFDLEGPTEDTAIGYEDEAFLVQDLTEFELFLHWVKYGRISGRVATQFSLGPVVQKSRAHFRQGEAEGTPLFFENESEQKQTAFGIDLGLGVEWFFTRRMSLGGQVGIQGLVGTMKIIQIFRSGTGPTYEFDRTEREGDSISLETNSSRIVLTGYF